jgi:DNA mismatch endonuclease (patch repair protein)
LSTTHKMTDVFDPETRKRVMSSIRSKNSKAEKVVFRYLKSEKIYFQKHYKKAPGTPDIALPRKKKAVFIDGDFWHGKRLQETIERRGLENYWTQKVLNNIERDKKQEQKLLENGWSFIRIWESDINRKRTQSKAFEYIKCFLTSSI